MCNGESVSASLAEPAVDFERLVMRLAGDTVAGIDCNCCFFFKDAFRGFFDLRSVLLAVVIMSGEVVKVMAVMELSVREVSLEALRESLKGEDCFLVAALGFGALGALGVLGALTTLAEVLVDLNFSGARVEGLGLAESATEVGVWSKSEPVFNSVLLPVPALGEGLGRRGLKEGLIGTNFWRRLTGAVEGLRVGLMAAAGLFGFVGAAAAAKVVAVTSDANFVCAKLDFEETVVPLKGEAIFEELLGKTSAMAEQ